MFSLLFRKARKPTLFEKLLLVIGISIGVVGFWLINVFYQANSELSWQFLITVFIWLSLIFMTILTASSESIKEDLVVIIRQHIEETKLIREQIKLLNATLLKTRKK